MSTRKKVNPKTREHLVKGRCTEGPGDITTTVRFEGICVGVRPQGIAEQTPCQAHHSREIPNRTNVNEFRREPPAMDPVIFQGRGRPAVEGITKLPRELDDVPPLAFVMKP